MSRMKARTRISYVLPLPKQNQGHRLGVNGLAVDRDAAILYTGGRDGVICAWDLHLDLNTTRTNLDEPEPKASSLPATTFRQQVKAHTHWINDIALAQANQALLSASSDITVKLWRPWAADGLPPQTIGSHSDYVKTLAVPSLSSDWAASGALDRKICLWDLSGAGQKLSIDVGSDEAGTGKVMAGKEKGSVYALAATESMIASGGPESTVRVWDPRSGQRITKLAGHTDNVRDILIARDGTTIITASSDQTVKVWSTLDGRCMFTLTMHDASVWSLYSRAADLSVFYSTDRTGLIAKTDTRGTVELDDGLSVAIAQEHEGVHKIIQAGDYIWAATSRPSVNRWRDISTDDAEIEIPPNYTMPPSNSQALKLGHPSPPLEADGAAFHPERSSSVVKAKRKLPFKHMLHLSNTTAQFPTPIVDSERRPSAVDRTTAEAVATPDPITMEPVRSQADFAIEGQVGLIKHVMLNDRKTVLTIDTAGEVIMWDLLKCVPIKSFGKRHLEDVRDEFAQITSVANWCSVNTRAGSVAVVLEDHTCFDGEIYADELELDNSETQFREDQRINLGKWVLRHLFSTWIDEEIKRDVLFRDQLLTAHKAGRLQRNNAPTSIQMPQNDANGWHQRKSDSNAATPKAVNSGTNANPGLTIALATPAISTAPAAAAKGAAGDISVTPTRNSAEDPQQAISASDRAGDYFSNTQQPSAELISPGGAGRAVMTPNESAVEEATTPLAETPPQPAQGAVGKFGKKFSMRAMSFSGMKKIGRRDASDKEKAAAAAAAEKEEPDSDARSAKTDNSRVFDDSALGVVQRIHHSYEDSLQQQVQGQQAHANGLPVAPRPGGFELHSAIMPTGPNEAPSLTIPPDTTILIQEERPEAGGVADVFEGPVSALGELCDTVEKLAPPWLGEVLLLNRIPAKEVAKVSFFLEPFEGSGLAPIGTDGNNRLNANRMLRAKKILSYIAERIEPPPEEGENRPRAEEYLELWCHGQLVPDNMTLATMRSHVWRGTGDVSLLYKSKGTRKLKPLPTPNIPLSPRPAANEGNTASA